MYVPVGSLAKLLRNSFDVLVNWREHKAWLIFFVGSPLGLCLGITLINPEYMGKLFQFSGDTWWLGPTAILASLVLTLLTLPLSGVCQRFLAAPNRNVFVIFKLAIVLLTALALWLISFFVIILTPAAITMIEQMKHLR